jgi:hypothetical protein
MIEQNIFALFVLYKKKMENDIPPPLTGFNFTVKKIETKNENKNDNFLEMIKKKKKKEEVKKPVFISQKIGNGDKKLRIIVISDTHNSIHTLDIPEGDVLIHCGDSTNNGSKEEIFTFNVNILVFFKHRNIWEL